MTSDWVKIVTLDNRQKAELLRTLMESNNIPAVIMDKKDSLYNIGSMELYCPAENALKALEIVEFNMPL